MGTHLFASLPARLEVSGDYIERLRQNKRPLGRATVTSVTQEPGWYPDPDDPSRTRWWDGGAWTQVDRPTERTSPAKVMLIVLAILTSVAVVAGVVFFAFIAFVLRVSGPEDPGRDARQILFEDDTEITSCTFDGDVPQADIVSNAPLAAGDIVTVYVDFLDDGEILGSGAAQLMSDSLSERPTAVVVPAAPLEIDNLSCELRRITVE